MEICFSDISQVIPVATLFGVSTDMLVEIMAQKGDYNVMYQQLENLYNYT